MSKIVSIHIDECKNPCSNKKQCYLRKRAVHGTDIQCEIKWFGEGFYDWAASNDVQVHWAVSCTDNIYPIECDMEEFDNFHMTLPYKFYKRSTGLKKYGSRIQVTVHDVKELKAVQKDGVQALYLVKDKTTFKEAIKLLKKQYKVHLNIDQEWVRNNRQDFDYLVTCWPQIPDHVTVDSCVQNYALYGKCMFIKDYIDINYDGTVRRCPFESQGVPIGNKTMDELFKVKYKPNCIYTEIFRRK
jgi:hypothetical protein